MKKSCALLAMVFAAAGCSASDATPGDKKGVVVEFDALKSAAPAEWQKEETVGGLRFMQFKLPKVKDDKADAEVVIFKGIGGSAKQNIDRWKGFFKAPEGKTIDDVAKVTESKVGDASVSTLDVSGTYMYKAQPNNPNAKAEARPNWRMVGVVFEGKDNPYHIRLVGPAATVENYQAGFDKWIKNFK